VRIDIPSSEVLQSPNESENESSDDYEGNSVSDNSDASSSAENDEQKRSRGTRWHRAQPQNWKRNVAKKMKLEAKRRKMACNNCRWNCVERFSEEDRPELCATYNGLKRCQKKGFSAEQYHY